MNIAVLGSGYVGTTTAAILANCGHSVTVIDVDANKVKSINSGKAPFFEIGIAQLIKSAVDGKTLEATTSYEEGIKDKDVVFSCVGTPDKPDGSSNLDYVFSAAESAAKFLDDNSIFVQKSTVPVGTGDQVIKLISKTTQKNIHYVSNPEFLREGSAVVDTLLFDRVVAGGNDSSSVEKVLGIYLSIESGKHTIDSVAGLNMPEHVLADHKGQYIPTSLQSAELIKLTANAFLALKISFANSVAKLADKTDADINEVMDAVGSDKRIGRAFLYAGRGYGGGCFPKDVSGLIMSARKYGVDFDVMTSAAEVNESMPAYIIKKLIKSVGSLKAKKVAVLGLAFKENTSDARRSPAVKIANLLVEEKANVIAYDPAATEEAQDDLNSTVVTTNKAIKAVSGADILIVSTAWDEFKNMNLDTIRKSTKGDVFVDAMNAFDKEDVTKAGFKYIGVGR